MRTKTPHRQTIVPAVVLALLAPVPNLSHADAIPMPGETDDRIRTAVYQSDQVYRLTGRVGYQLDLQFASDERFVGLAAGDVQGVGFEAQNNHLFLKPKAARVATNLTVLTNRRHYYLDYSVQPQRITADGIESLAAPIYALRFLYPEEESGRAAAEAAAKASDAQVTTALQATPGIINRNYAFCGPRAIKPDNVTDDGVRTRFTFGARTELPAIFTRSGDGTESLVNFTVNPDGITVHRVSPQFILRRGRLVGCVVNQSFSGAGDRLASGTVSPDVARAVPHAPDTSANTQATEVTP